MANSLDMWIVQLDELCGHALNMREDNVLKYEGKELEAFEAGLNMMILLMKTMLDDMMKERKSD